MPERSFVVPDVDTHLVASNYVDQTFQIRVMQPLTARGDDSRFPVLYVTEGNSTFDVARHMSLALQVSGQVARFILVGIGYPGDHPFASSILRGRDLMPERYPDIPGLPERSRIEGVPSVEKGKKRLRGGADFLAFIRNELTAYIDARYPTVPGDRAYFGHSLGGTLGLHALFSHPGIFKRFIVSSPGLSWDGDDHGIREAQEFVASGNSIDARLFVSVGELEEFEAFLAKSRFVSSFYRLVGLLRRASIPGLELSSRCFSGEGHMSVWPLAFSRGIRAVYGPGEGPVMGIPAWESAEAGNTARNA